MSVGSFFMGLKTLTFSTTVFQEMIGFMLFIITSIFLTGACIVLSIERLKKDKE